MAIKKFKVNNIHLDWEYIVEIDEEKAKKPIKEMVEFWASWEKELSENDNDYTKTFLKMLGKNILLIIISNNYNLYGVLQEFKNEKEGWYPLDGEYGIKIIDFDDFEIERDDFEIEEY